MTFLDTFGPWRRPPVAHLSGCDSIFLRLLKDSPRRALHLSAARPDLAHLIVKRARCMSRCEGGRPRSPEGKKASVNGGGEELKLMKSRRTRRLAVFVPVPEDDPVRSSSSNLLRDVVLGYNTCRFGPKVTLQPYFIPRHSWCDPRLWSQSFLQTQSRFALCRVLFHPTLAEPVPVHLDVSCKKNS